MRLFRFPLLLLIALAMAGCDNHSSQPRYQFVSNPQMADMFLLDNQKGRIWQLTTSTDVPGHPVEVWEEIDIIDSKGEIGMTHGEFIKLHAADAKLQPPQDLISAQPAGKFVPDAAQGENTGKGKYDFPTTKPAAPDAVPDWAKDAPKKKLVDPHEKEHPNTAPGANTGGEK